MKYTRTALGLLTRQYRSVLKKCWLINVGLFALGAAGVMVPNEAEAATMTSNKLASLLSSNMTTSFLTWQTVNSGSGYTWDDSTTFPQASTFAGTPNGNGAVRFKLNGVDTYFKYTYSPGPKTQATSEISGPTLGVGKYFYDYIASGWMAAATTTGGHYEIDAISSDGNSGPGVFMNNGKTVDSLITTEIGNENVNFGLVAVTGYGYTDKIYGNFIGNKIGKVAASGDGGVRGTIQNTLNGFIGYIDANFVGNELPFGGTGGAAGVSNGQNAFIDTIKGNFIGNSTGGTDGASAISNANHSNIDTISANFVGNSGGSVIRNAGSSMWNDVSYSSHIKKIEDSNFISNTPTDAVIKVWNKGSSIGEIINSTFEDNSGVAIYMGSDTSLGEIVNSSFIGNHSASIIGGAINSTVAITITANDGGQSVFSGNYYQTADNNIAIYTPNVTLNAIDGGTITMDDKISGASGYAVHLTGNESGKIQLNDSILNSANVDLSDVTLELGNESVLNGDRLTLNGGYVDMRNDLVGLMSLSSLTRGAATNIGIDVSLGSGTSDRITASSHSGSANITIDSINLPSTKYSDSGARVSAAVTTDNNLKNYITLSPDIMANISGNNYYTDVSYSGGNVVFSNKLINTSELATQINAAANQSIATYDEDTGTITYSTKLATMDDIGGSYTAGDGIDITSDVISLDTTYMNNNYYTKYGLGGKKQLSSLAVCGASPRQGISTFGVAASISDIALRKGQIAGRSDAQRTSSDDNIGFAAANDNYNDNLLMPTSRASVRVFARGVAPQLEKTNSHPEAWQNMTRHPEEAQRADVVISILRLATSGRNNTAISLTTADARRLVRLPRRYAPRNDSIILLGTTVANDNADVLLTQAA